MIFLITLHGHVSFILAIYNNMYIELISFCFLYDGRLTEICASKTSAAFEIILGLT